MARVRATVSQITIVGSRIFRGYMRYALIAIVVIMGLVLILVILTVFTHLFDDRKSYDISIFTRTQRFRIPPSNLLYITSGID